MSLIITAVWRTDASRFQLPSLARMPIQITEFVKAVPSCKSTQAVDLRAKVSHVVVNPQTKEAFKKIDDRSIHVLVHDTERCHAEAHIEVDCKCQIRIQTQKQTPLITTP